MSNVKCQMFPIKSGSRMKIPMAESHRGSRLKTISGTIIGTIDKGFTLTELIIVMVIFVTLVGLATVNLVGAKQRTALNTSIEILLADMRQQQLKSMIGDTEGRATPDTYGIHFAANNYVLFHGASYIPGGPANFIVDLGDSIQIVGSPADMLYQRVSGEITTAGTLVLQDNVTKEQKTLQFNQYGVVMGMN